MKAPIIFVLCFCIFGSGANAQKKALLPEKVPFDKQEIEKQQERQKDAKEPSLFNSNFKHRISGTISSARKSSLSFPVAGFTKTIMAKAGTRLKKGDVLASLDDRDYQLQLDLAKANKKQAENQLLTLRNELAREKQLHLENASTNSRLEQVELSYKQAQIAAELAALNVKGAEKNLDSTKLRAPYDCVVAKQHKDEAEYVAVGNKVFDINEINANELNLDVPASLIGKFTAGTKLAVTVSAVGYSGHAQVSRVVPVIANDTRTFQVTAVFIGEDERVVPGLFAEAQLN